MRFAAAVGRGGVKTPPYNAKDKRAVPARWRAGHARPLQTSVPGQSFHSAERCPINRTPKRPKNRLVRHCGQNAHNNSENMCNFLNKTPLRKGVFFGTIKLCKSVYLSVRPEQTTGRQTDKRGPVRHDTRAEMQYTLMKTEEEKCPEQNSLWTAIPLRRM